MANSCFHRSEYIWKRLMLLRQMEAPILSDANQNFGEDVAKRILCNCDPNFRVDLGLEPPLEGVVGKELWSSPSDLLIGKVCLKPPLTSKHIRALTHHGILEIGLGVEKLFWNHIEIEKSKGLEEQDRTTRLLCETSKREAIADVQKRMREIFYRQKNELIDEMETLCKNEIRRIEAKFQRDLQDELKEQALELEMYYQNKLEEEVIKTSEEITIKSSINLEEFEAAMQRTFQAQLQKIEIQAKFEIQKQQARCKEKLKILRHELECKNLANMMYIICMERKKCNQEKNSIEHDLTLKLQEFERVLSKRDEEIKKISDERDENKRRVDTREKALLEVIKEFQKFIYFALKSDPKQSEYLLSAEKLLVFELTEALSKVEIPPDHDRNYLWNRIPSDSESAEGSLRIKDGHECLKESEISESELSTDQFLPGFFYNDQMFVREDFRNKVSQGITLNENDMLWNRHVKDVLNILQNPCQSCPFNEENGDKRVLEKTKSIVSYQSSVHFCMREKDKSMTSIEKERKIRRASLKPTEPEAILQTIDFRNIGSEENRKTLISAKNSVELIKDSITKRKSSVRSEELSKIQELVEVEQKELPEERETQNAESNFILEAKDSIIKAKMHNFLQTTTEMKIAQDRISNHPRKSLSRLMEVTDSLELLKRKDSVVSERSSHKKNLCDLKECDMVNEIPSSSEPGQDENQEKMEQIKKFMDTPRRISIAFTGKPVIYDKDDEEDDKKSKKGQMKKKNLRVKKKKIKKHHPKTSGKLLSEVSTQTSLEEKHERILSESTRKIVMGDSNYKFYDKKNDQFTSERITSFINLIKDYPSLIRLFTSVTR